MRNDWVRITDCKGKPRTLENIELEVIRAALKRYPATVAARHLKMGRSTLYRRMKRARRRG